MDVTLDGCNRSFPLALVLPFCLEGAKIGADPGAGICAPGIRLYTCYEETLPGASGLDPAVHLLPREKC